MKNRKGLMGLFLVILIFALTGCGNEGDPKAAGQKEPTKSDSAQLIEPCELITQAEAEEIVGTALKEGQYSEQKMVGSKTCFYDSVDEDAFAFFQISINQKAFMPPKFLASGQSSKTLFSAIKDAFGDKRVDISGMGDEAFIGTPGIHILKGDYYMTIAIAIGIGKTDKNNELKKAAGEKALANLEAALK